MNLVRECKSRVLWHVRLRQLLSGPDNFYKFHNFYKLHDFDHSNEFNEFNEFNGRDVKFQLDRDDKESLQWRCQENFDGVCELDMIQNVRKNKFGFTDDTDSILRTYWWPILKICEGLFG